MKNEIINKQFVSKKYGPYIINDIFKDKNNYMAQITFIKSNAKTITRLSKAISGNIRDPNYGLNLNKIYYSDNYGAYKIINIIKGTINQSPKATIKFLNSNNIYTVLIHHALQGTVNDKLSSVHIPLDTLLLSNEDKELKLLRIAHDIWYSMNKRCYNKLADNYKSYGELGISICSSWLIFNNFFKDITELFQYDKWSRFPTIYQLDKDYLQINIPKNKRIYSKNTCIFLYFKDNINLRAMEFRKNNKMQSNYYGVTKESKNTYSAHLIINNQNIYLGTFSNEIVAANVYNYWYKYYHQYELVPLINDVPYIPPDEFIKYNTRPKEMCTIIRKENGL